MLRFFLEIAEKYGLDVLQLAVIIFLFWKLFCNHLKHIAQDLKDAKEERKEIKDDVKVLGERVSKVEGKLE